MEQGLAPAAASRLIVSFGRRQPGTRVPGYHMPPLRGSQDVCNRFVSPDGPGCYLCSLRHKITHDADLTCLARFIIHFANGDLNPA